MARPAPGADRSVAVLELLASHPDERFTLSEVARRCALNKATAHALLSTLSERGVLLRHPDEKRYSLGPRLVAIGDAARRGYTAVDFAPAVLDDLARATGLQARAWQVAGDQVVCVAHAGANGRADRPRLRLPLVPPVGLVFMAWSDPSTVEAWLARSGSVETVGPAVDGLSAVRRQGFAVMEASPEWLALTRAGRAESRARPGAGEEGSTLTEQRALLRAASRQSLVVGMLDDDRSYRPAEVAAPVFDATGSVALAVAVVGLPDEQLPGAEVRQIAQRVAGACDVLTSAVSGRRPPVAT